MKKKLLSIVCAAALAAGLLSGCGKGTEGKTDDAEAVTAQSTDKTNGAKDEVIVTMPVTSVRVVIQHFSKNTVISMVLGHPNSEITCIPPS